MQGGSWWWWIHEWWMIRRKEIINGAQRLHTIIMARAAQEFHGNARFCVSSSSNNAATSREEEEEEEEAVPRPPPPPISQPGRVQKIKDRRRAWGNEWIVFFFLLFKFFLLLLFFLKYSSACSWSFVVHEEVHDGLVVVFSGRIQRSVSTMTLQVEVRISLEQFSDSGLSSIYTSKYQRSPTIIVLCVYLCIGLQEQWYHCVVTMLSRLHQSSQAVLLAL